MTAVLALAGLLLDKVGWWWVDPVAALAVAGERRQAVALRIIGIAFLVLALYLAVQSTFVLAVGYHAKHSVLGI